MLILSSSRMLEPEAFSIAATPSHFRHAVPGYEYSHFHRAVHILFSRIVRPIWFREPVQVDRERRDKFVHLLNGEVCILILCKCLC
jgi:hypothetical protein